MGWQEVQRVKKDEAYAQHYMFSKQFGLIHKHARSPGYSPAAVGVSWLNSLNASKPTKKLSSARTPDSLT
jgi:hypothetical protein